MKSVLMALVLMSSMAAQARVDWQEGHREYKNERIENLALDGQGTVQLTTGRTKYQISKRVVEQTGLTTKEFIDLVEKYNTRGAIQILTFKIELNPDLVTVGRLTISISQ
jgi:opacity protein-like surface antigen